MIAAIVLAAGRSQRFGAPKLMEEVLGRPLLQWAIDSALASNVDQVVVVLGHRSAELRARLRRGRFRVIHNPKFEEGLSTSLKAGLEVLPPDCEAACVFLGDTPFVPWSATNEVIHQFRSTGMPVWRPCYRNVPGHPVLVGRDVWPLIVDLKGDVGLRTLLLNYPDSLISMNMDPPRDVDTIDDLEHLRREVGQSPALPTSRINSRD